MQSLHKIDNHLLESTPSHELAIQQKHDHFLIFCE